jgi:peptide/nickel transport system ATP-binding protein
VPDPLHRPSGCSFHPRCAEAIAGVCDVEGPPEVEFGRDGTGAAGARIDSADRRTVECVLYADREGAAA